MKFGSVCSGIEAASVAWHPLGWRAAWLAEIEAFPSAVLAQHYPDVQNLGDMTAIADLVRFGAVAAPDVLVGGTPCQAFSVAGLRGGLSDARGAITLSFVETANAIDDARRLRGEEPCVVVWENVPGVLSSSDNAFGCFLGALAGSGCELQPPGGRWRNAGCVYGPTRAVAWRVLDAQYFGLAQRRRRVFVVASARDGFDPAAVLLEWDGVRRDSAPSREAREGTAGGAQAGAGNGGWPADVASTLNAYDACDTARPLTTSADRTLAAPIAVDCYNGAVTGDVAATMGTRGSSVNSTGPTVMSAMQVRRLTPRECERLQGFPDDYTLIPWRKKPDSECPDGPRYKALGNSMAVPVMRWIGERIAKLVTA